VGGVVGSLWLVFGAVSVLLLIACTNIAALLFSRAVQREHEIVVRYALGASRRAVAAQLLAEAAVLASSGAAVGLLVATAASSATRLLAPDLPRLDEITVDTRMLLYTAASAVIVTLACGLVPAIRGARGGASPRASRRHVVPRQSLQWLLVGVQVALSVTLLAGAGLLLRSIGALARVDPGFESGGVLTFHVTGRFGEDGGDYLRVVERINRTLDALREVRGITAAATAATLPGLPGENQIEFTLVEASAGPHIIGEPRSVSPGYFQTMHIPLLSGDVCRRESRDTVEAMVNRSFADRYLPGRSVVGLHLTWAWRSQPARIAGVVGDARETGTDRDPVPTVYECVAAPNPAPWFLVRTSGDPLAAAGTVRLKVKDLEPLRPVYDVAPLETRIAGAYAQTRMRTVLLTLFAVTALGLVCAGVYGTVSYAVGLRRREVALQLALGALRRDVVRQLVGTSFRIVATASACGLVLTLIFSRSLSTMLYGVSPFDPATLSGVIVVVLMVAAMAAVIPAARAAFVEPMQALRDE
jgi:predicted permease